MLESFKKRISLLLSFIILLTTSLHTTNLYAEEALYYSYYGKVTNSSGVVVDKIYTKDDTYLTDEGYSRERNKYTVYYQCYITNSSGTMLGINSDTSHLADISITNGDNKLISATVMNSCYIRVSDEWGGGEVRVYTGVYPSTREYNTNVSEKVIFDGENLPDARDYITSVSSTLSNPVDGVLSSSANFKDNLEFRVTSIKCGDVVKSYEKSSLTPGEYNVKIGLYYKGKFERNVDSKLTILPVRDKLLETKRTDLMSTTLPQARDYVSSYSLDSRDVTESSTYEITGVTSPSGVHESYDFNTIITKTGNHTVTIKATNGYYNTTQIATLTVPKTLNTIGSIAGVNQRYPKSYDNIKTTLNSNAKVNVTLKDGTTQQCDTTGWQCNSFNQNTSGTYTFTGQVVLPADISNMCSVPLAVQCQVNYYKSVPTSVKTGTSDNVIEVPWNTPVDDIYSRISNTATISCSDGNVDTLDLSAYSWIGTIEPETPGEYTLTKTINLPEQYAEGGLTNITVNQKVRVLKPEIVEVVNDLSPIEVQFNTALDDVKNQLPTQVTVKLNDGSNKTFSLEKDNWTTTNYNNRQIGSYTLTYTLDATDAYTLKEGQSLTFKCKVNEVPVELESIEEEPYTELNYERQTEESIIKNDLVSKVILHCSNNYTEEYNLVKDSWESTDYDRKRAGRYTFSQDINLPNYIKNNNLNLTIARSVTLDSPKVTKAEFLVLDPETNTERTTADGLHLVEVPYGTSFNDALGECSMKLKLTLSDGTYENINLDRNLFRCENYNSRIPNIYIAKADVSELIPGYINLESSSLVVSQKIRVLNPVLNNAEVINTNQELLEIGTRHYKVQVPYNTDKESLIKNKLPKSFKATFNNGDVKEFSLDNSSWICEDYAKNVPGVYTFTNRLLNDYYNNQDNLNITVDVEVLKPTLNRIEFDDSTLELDPVETLESTQDKMPTTATLVANEGYTEEVNLLKESWVSNNFSPKETGNYTFNYILELPNTFRDTTRMRLLYKNVSVGTPSVSGIDYHITTDGAIHVAYGTEFSDAQKLLMKNVQVALNDGTTRTLPIKTNSWSCPEYNKHNPGIYKAKTKVELPSDIRNKYNKTLDIEQLIYLEEATLIGLDPTSFPVLEYEYGTELSRIMEDVPNVAKYTLNDNSQVSISLDPDTWVSNYEKGSIPGNYQITNTCYINTETREFIHCTTEEGLNLEFTTRGALQVNPVQQIAITNRKVSKTTADTPNKNFISMQQALQALPNKFKVYFANGEVVEVDECSGWVVKSGIGNSGRYVFTTEVKLPEYSEGDNIVEIEVVIIPPEIQNHTESSSSSTSSDKDKIEELTQTPKQPKIEKKYNNISFEVGSEDWEKNNQVQSTKLDVTPEITDSRLCIPLRYIALALNIQGNDVKWNAKEHKAILVKDGKTVVVEVGTDKVIVNNEEKYINGVSYIKDGRVMLPISQICKVLLDSDEYSIKWRPETKQVKLVFEGNDADNLEGYVDYRDKEL